MFTQRQTTTHGHTLSYGQHRVNKHLCFWTVGLNRIDEKPREISHKQDLSLVSSRWSNLQPPSPSLQIWVFQLCFFLFFFLRLKVFLCRGLRQEKHFARSLIVSPGAEPSVLTPDKLTSPKSPRSKVPRSPFATMTSVTSRVQSRRNLHLAVRPAHLSSSPPPETAETGSGQTSDRC